MSYVILSSDKLDDMISILYAKEYQIIPIKGYYRGQYEDSVIAFGRVDNDNLRKEHVSQQSNNHDSKNKHFYEIEHSSTLIQKEIRNSPT
jgi:hypothetical protein